MVRVPVSRLVFSLSLLASACAPDPSTVVDVTELADGGVDLTEQIPEICGDGIDQDENGVADDVCNRVFVTPVAIPLADLVVDHDPLAALDARCNGFASAAGLSGHFVGWVSTPTVDARDRLGSARGFVRIDGRPIAADVDDFANGHHLYPITFGPSGETLDVPVATASAIGGVHDDDDCGGYANLDDTHSIYSGYAVATGTLFSSNGYPSCDEPHYFYCVQTDYDAELAPRPIPNDAHVAFVSTAVFNNGTGVVGADAICASEATAAGLVGEFIALLPGKGASAISRLVSDGRPVVRTDGVVIADDEATFGVPTWRAPLAVVADGSTTIGNSLVWTGAVTPTSLSNGSCLGFTVTSSMSSAAAVIAGRAWPTNPPGPNPCSSSAQLYCISR